jgi:hypothetical protein
LSLYVPVAKNCTSVLAAMDGLAGVTAIDTRAGVTVTASEPAILPIFAETEHWPLALALSIPPAATLATLASLVLHVAVEVTSLLLPSLYLPVAVSCWLWPATALPLKPVACIEVRVGPLLPVPVAPPLPPQAVSAKRIQTVRQTAAFLILPPTSHDSASSKSNADSSRWQKMPLSSDTYNVIYSGVHDDESVLHIDGSFFGSCSGLPRGRAANGFVATG